MGNCLQNQLQKWRVFILEGGVPTNTLGFTNRYRMVTCKSPVYHLLEVAELWQLGSLKKLADTMQDDSRSSVAFWAA